LQHQLVKLQEGQSISDIGSTILIGADTNEKQIKGVTCDLQHFLIFA
jgi:hypothetical protein